MVVIFVVLTVLFFVGIDFLLQMRQRKEAAAQPATAGFAPRTVRDMAEGLKVPSGLFVHPGHTWAQILRSGAVKVGTDEFVRRAMDRIDGVSLRKPGEHVTRGEPLMAVVRDGKNLVLPAPVSGVVDRVNPTIASDPRVMETKPYSEGWAYMLKPARLAEDLKHLKVAESAGAWLVKEVRRFGEWVKDIGPAMSPAEATMQDGGAPVTGALRYFDDNGWDDFQKEFLGIPTRQWPHQKQMQASNCEEQRQCASES